MMSIIDVKGLKKSFRSGVVLKGLNLSVEEGTIYGLVGRNGAGKTTLLRLLMGLAIPDDGHAHVLGVSFASGCPTEKAQVAYVAQGPFLPVWARIKDLVGFESEVRPSWDATSLEAWLSSESLPSSRRIRDMSPGQRKRLELELALCARPKVLLLDEPFEGLDPPARADFMEQLIGYAASASTTIVLSSHILSDLERLCDRVGVLAQGVIAYETPLEVLKERAVIVSADRPDALQKIEGVAIEEIGSHTRAGRTTWVLSHLGEPEAETFEAAGVTVRNAGLEELGVELIRCLDSR